MALSIIDVEGKKLFLKVNKKKTGMGVLNDKESLGYSFC
jgi:hypothetical protein